MPDQPERKVSITWYEYLRAVATGKDTLILVRSEIWNQLRVFQEARKRDRAFADNLAQAVNVPEGLLDFLEYVLAQPRRNWIHTFTDLPNAREVLTAQLPSLRAEDERLFRGEVGALLSLANYRGCKPEAVAAAAGRYFVAETGDRFASIQVAVHCCFQSGGRRVCQADLEPFLKEFESSGLDRALIVTNAGFDPRTAVPRRVTLVSHGELLAGLVDFSEYITRVRHDYNNYDPRNPPLYLPLRTDLKKHFVPLDCEGAYEGELFACVRKFLEDPEMNHLTILGDFGTGKSSSMMELTCLLLAEDAGRTPLFFSLRDFVHVDSLQTLITKGLTEKYGVPPFHYESFVRLSDEGRLLLIFDAFDEMATLSERWATMESLRRLNEAVRPRGKVMLTCRTHYFSSRKEERARIEDSLRAGGGELFTEIAGRRNLGPIMAAPGQYT